MTQPTARQLPVLLEMINAYEAEQLCTFDTLATHLQMDRRDIRNVCRALKRRGLADHMWGISNRDDGMLHGSGYMLTKKGYDVAILLRGRK